MMFVSYGLIAAIGAFLFITRLLEKLSKKKREAEEKTDLPVFSSNKNTIVMALSIGAVPCPGIIILLLFAISLGIVKTGLLMVLFMGIGMAGTISAVGILTIWVKKGTLNLFPRHSGMQGYVENTLELGGSFLIMLLGGVLFISTM